MSNRKLWISTVGILRRNLHPSLRFPPDVILKLESARFFSCSFYAGKSMLYRSCKDRSPENLSFFSRNFCSVSLERERGVLTCWNCGAVATSEPFLACESCKSVQQVDPSVNYFQIFGLEKEYEIKDGNLENKYKDWQKKLHPDLVHSKSEREKEYAAEQSARVIDAYRTLSKPLSRAVYMLRLEGIHVDEETTISDPEFLAEILDIREAVEEAADSHTLNQIQGQMQQKLESWFKSFRDAFKNRKFEDAVYSIQRMTYYERVNEEIVKKL